MKSQRKVIFGLIILSFMLVTPLGQISNAEVNEINQLSVGNTGGVLWAYNEHKERVRDTTINLADSSSVDKSVENSRTFTTNMNLITGTQNVDFFSDRFTKFVKRDGTNSGYKHEKGLGLKGAVGNTTGNVDNIFVAGINAFYRYDWASTYIFTFDKNKFFGQALLGLAGGVKAYSGNIYVGNAITSAWFTTNVTVEVLQMRTVPIIDIFKNEYGQMQVPELNITYLFDVDESPSNLLDDEVTLIERIVPKYQLIVVQTENHQVSVTQSSITSASLQGSYNFTGQYSETNQGHEVLISDANAFVFGWYGLESTTINYQQTGGFTIQGDLAWNLTRDITFTSNETKVNEDIRMPWWKSSNMTFSGIWSHKFSDTGSIEGKGALQTVVQAIRTRASTEANDQLLIWANLIPSTMFGYIDLDNSGDASVRLNGSMLEILDEIMAVGFVHGINLEQTYDYVNFVNAKSFWQLGNKVLNNKNENKANQGTVILDETWGVDPSSADFSAMSVDFTWENPVETNGKVEFNWGIDYTDFPTTWHVTDGITEILDHVEIMDVGYDYTLVVDPAKGEAELSNTYMNSGIQNATVKSMVDGLSLGTYKRDLFLGMQKASDSADSTEAINDDALSTSFGSTQIIDQTFGGTKQAYSLADTSTDNSQVTIINVITGTGTSGEPESVNVSRYSPFASSRFARNVGVSLLKWSADNRTLNTGIDWEFRENLVITAYPTWDGQGVTHDPTFATVYTPSGDSNDSGTGDAGASWEIYSSIFALILIPSITKIRNKRKNN